MIARVIGLVGARRDAMADGPALGFQHRLGGAAFRPAIGRRDHARHRKPVPVLHGDMAEVAELGRAGRPEESCRHRGSQRVGAAALVEVE